MLGRCDSRIVRSRCCSKPTKCLTEGRKAPDALLYSDQLTASGVLLTAGQVRRRWCSVRLARLRSVALTLAEKWRAGQCVRHTGRPFSGPRALISKWCPAHSTMVVDTKEILSGSLLPAPSGRSSFEQLGGPSSACQSPQRAAFWRSRRGRPKLFRRRRPSRRALCAKHPTDAQCAVCVANTRPGRYKYLWRSR